MTRYGERAPIVGIVEAAKQPIEGLVAKSAAVGVRNPTFYDLDGAAHRKWSVMGHPTILIVDAEGLVVRKVDFITMCQGAAEQEAARELAGGGLGLLPWQQRMERVIAGELDKLLR